MREERQLNILEQLVWAIAMVFVLLGAYGRSGGDPADSRLATVYSLAHFGTFYIDRPPEEDPNPFEQRTIDKVMVKGERVGSTVRNGRLISSKPPMLPLLMTGEYLVLKALLGRNLEDREQVRTILLWMTITLIGTAYLGTLVFFVKTLTLFIEERLSRLLLLVCLAFATQLWGYSTLLNNHVPAACMVMVALYFCLGVGSGKIGPAWWRFFLFGLASALAFTFDLPSTIFVAFAGLYLLVKFPRKTLIWATAGAVAPLGIHFGILFAVTGTFAPVQLQDEVYLYEASYWRHPRGIDALNEPKGTYLFHMTFGRCGLFSLYPILLAGVASALRALVRTKSPLRGYILTGALAFIILTAYYAKATNNYGGEAYGFRWYIPAMPVLLLMGAPLFPALRKPWHKLFLCVLIAVSFYSAWECTRTGWAANRQWTCRFLGPSY